MYIYIMDKKNQPKNYCFLKYYSIKQQKKIYVIEEMSKP